MSVAMTISSQLGGSRFRAMTGAHSFTAGPDRLQFGLPKGLKVVVVLDPSDTYTVSLYRVRGSSIKLVSEADGVYADSLRNTFTRMTGLEVSL